MFKDFEGRRFLLEYEHQTYLRRMPVRYIKHPKTKLCSVCGLPASEGNPLENSHLIPFGKGVKIYKLTPDYLDNVENIVTAHKNICNKSVELDHDAIIQRITSY